MFFLLSFFLSVSLSPRPSSSAPVSSFFSPLPFPFPSFSLTVLQARCLPSRSSPLASLGRYLFLFLSLSLSLSLSLCVCVCCRCAFRSPPSSARRMKTRPFLLSLLSHRAQRKRQSCCSQSVASAHFARFVPFHATICDRRHSKCLYFVVGDNANVLHGNVCLPHTLAGPKKESPAKRREIAQATFPFTSPHLFCSSLPCFAVSPPTATKRAGEGEVT